MPIIRDILYGAAQYGASLPALCRELKISSTDLNRSDIVADFKTAYTTWEVAVKATGDPTLGLRLGAITTPSILGIVGHVMQNCRTLHEAFSRVCAFSAVATDMFKYALTDKGEQTVLTFSPAHAWIRVSPATARQASDQAMRGCLNVFFLLSGRRLQPVSAAFTCNKPSQLERYTQSFGCPLRFGAKSNALIFQRADLQHPLNQYDQSLLTTFEALARKQLHKRQAKRSFADEVVQCMRYEFAARVPSLEVMAAHMNISVRTFQRKLSAERKNYRDIADQVSKEIALSLLASGKTRVSDVSHLMGYSEPSAFRRAFRRWTKSTPRKARPE